MDAQRIRPTRSPCRLRRAFSIPGIQLLIPRDPASHPAAVYQLSMGEREEAGLRGVAGEAGAEGGCDEC